MAIITNQKKKKSHCLVWTGNEYKWQKTSHVRNGNYYQSKKMKSLGWSGFDQKWQKWRHVSTGNYYQSKENVKSTLK